MSISPIAATPPAFVAPAAPPPSADHSRRRGELVARLRQSESAPGAVLIRNSLDIFYLTGVREGISWMAVWDGGCFVVTRHMLLREVEGVAGNCEILLPSPRSTDRVNQEAFVLEELRRRGFKKVGVELENLSAGSYLELAKQAADRGLELAELPRLMEKLRHRKDGHEMKLIRRCVAIAEEAFSGLISDGAQALLGRCERDVALELESRMLALGADRQGFPDTGIIVASGPHSASAHHNPGKRLIEAGEPLLIDWGAELDGYRSDMTRTLFPGWLPEFARRAYPVVEAAMAAAVEVLAVGAKMGDVDNAARETVVAAGFPEFHYGVGHGIGLAIHEGPWLRAHSEELIEQGMVTTLEPGVYLHGTGGIRIESIYALTDRGKERLDRLPVTLDEMVLE